MLQAQGDGADGGSENEGEDNETDDANDDDDDDEGDLENFYYAGDDADAEKVLDRFKIQFDNTNWI